MTNLIDDAEPLRVCIGARESLKNDLDAMAEQLRCVSKSRISGHIGYSDEVEMTKI